MSEESVTAPVPEGTPAEAPAADSAPPGPPSMADRLAGVCIDLRSDLEVIRHEFRGEPHYVLRDPVSFGSHSFSLDDYRILTQLRGERTLGETFQQLVEMDALTEGEEERFYQFIFSLHKIGLLHLPISDEKTLYGRYESRRRAKRAQFAKSLLFFRIPLFAPDAFLTRTMPFVRPFFTRLAFWIWMAVTLLAGYVLVRNWAEFTEPVGDIFRNENLPLLWITLIALKVFHEFGHAYATKAFGGRVPEMGLFLMIFTPCAYVDASAAWGFSRRRDRIIVCMAGMYVELFLAALCLLAWSVMDAGLWRSVLHNAVMLASVITIGFNINPLMRYDGYYALSDALEIPNLRARAGRECTALMKRVLLGVSEQGREISSGLRTFLVGFGVAGGIYKVTLVLGISATIAIKFPVVGLLLGGVYCLGEIVGVIKKCLPYLWRSEETAHVRLWAVALSLLILVGLPAALMLVPLPASVTTVAVLSGQDEVLLRAKMDGFVEALPVHEGRMVEAGEVIVALSDPAAHARLQETLARLDAARTTLSRSRTVDVAQAASDEEHVRYLEDEVAARREELSELSVTTPLHGRLTTCLDPTVLGRYVRRGEPVASVVGGRTVVRALLSEEQVAATRPTPGLAVQFRSIADPGRLWKGRISRVSPAGRREFDQPFARFLDPADYAVNPTTGLATRSQFEIEVELDDTGNAPHELQGMRGKLRIGGDPEPIGARFLRKSQTFIRRLTG